MGFLSRGLQWLVAAAVTVCVLSLAVDGQTYLEPCIFTEGDFYNYDQVTQCFYSIRMDETIKLQTIETMRKAIEVYAFLDIANHSPDPHLPVQIDMLAGLQTIENRPYVYDMDFQSDLRALFDQLNDAHTQYYLPTCYQNVLVRQPFAPVGFGDTTENYKITISPYFDEEIIDYYEDSVGLNVTDYVGMEILEIDGVSPFDYFLKYANNSVGMAKDLGTRFNFALTVPEPRNDIQLIQYGYWQQREHRNPYPKQPYVYYKLQSPDGTEIELSVPWSFKALATYSGVESFQEDYFASSIIGSPEHLKEQLESVQQELQLGGPTKAARAHSFMNIPKGGKGEAVIEEHKRKLLAEHFPHIENVEEEMSFELLVNTTHLTFWALSDNQTLVMFLDSMEPDADGLSGYYVGLKEGFEIAADRGLTRLIIDLTNNGGGNICIGRTLLAFLQQEGWAGQGQNWGPQDLPLSPLAVDCINTAAATGVETTIWSPAYYDNMTDFHVANDDTSYLLPGVPHIRGGNLRNYSRLVHLDACGGFGYRIEPAVNFSPDQVMIITRGLCGSTCALFANHMALYDNIQTVVVGGIPQQQEMQYTAFPGLQVLDNGPLMSMFAQLGKNITTAAPGTTDDDPVPRLLPTTAGFRFCVREIYPPSTAEPPRPPQETNPTEYSFQQATQHIYNDELIALYPMYTWYQVLDFFP